MSHGSGGWKVWDGVPAWLASGEGYLFDLLIVAFLLYPQMADRAREQAVRSY